MSTMGSGPVIGTLYEKTAREQAKRIGWACTSTLTVLEA